VGGYLLTGHQLNRISGTAQGSANGSTRTGYTSGGVFTQAPVPDI